MLNKEKKMLFPTEHDWYMSSHCGSHAEDLWNDNKANPLTFLNENGGWGWHSRWRHLSPGSLWQEQVRTVWQRNKETGQEAKRRWVSNIEIHGRNLQGKSLRKQGALTLSQKNERGEGRKNDKNPNQECTLQEKRQHFVQNSGVIFTHL